MPFDAEWLAELDEPGARRPSLLDHPILADGPRAGSSPAPTWSRSRASGPASTARRPGSWPSAAPPSVTTTTPCAYAAHGRRSSTGGSAGALRRRRAAHAGATASTHRGTRRRRRRGRRLPRPGRRRLRRPRASPTSSGRRAAPAAPIGRTAASPTAPANELRRDGDVWHVTYGGVDHDRAAQQGPGRPGRAPRPHRAWRSTSPSSRACPRRRWAAPAATRSTAGPSRAYRDRLAELADGARRRRRRPRPRPGRARPASSTTPWSTSSPAPSGSAAGRRAAGPEPVERLRKAVSARIRDAIRQHRRRCTRALGRHLASAVRTGMYCSYRPEEPTVWRCQTRSGACGA